MTKTVTMILIQVLLLFLSSSFLHSQNQELFWDKESLIIAGNIGKFEIISNDKIIGMLYSELTNNYKLLFKYSTDGLKWSNPVLIADDLAGPSLLGVDFSGAVNRENDIYICYRTNKNKFNIISMPLNTLRLKKMSVIESENIIFLPKLSIDINNSIHIVYSNNRENRLLLEYIKFSSDGTEQYKNTISTNYKYSINPFISIIDNIIYVAFQAKEDTVQGGVFYSIYLASSSINKNEWSFSRIVTSTGQNNQGPHFYIDGRQCHMVWEKEDSNYVNHVYYKSFNIDALSSVSTSELPLSVNNSESHSPNVLKYKNNIYAFWYDNLSGSFQNFYALIIKDQIVEKSPVIPKPGRTLNSTPFFFKDNLILFWLQLIDRPVLYLTKADNFIEQPAVFVRNLNSSRLTNLRSIELQWNNVIDYSGTAGYRILLTKNDAEEILKDAPLLPPKELSVSYKELEDGNWIFKIQSYDIAGNESITAKYPFTVDTIAPFPPVIISPEIDSEGALKTNSISISWDNSNKELKLFNIYYNLFTDKNLKETDDYINELSLKDFKMTADKNLDLANLDNGIFLFGIQGYDNAGNASDIKWEKYILNKYVTATFISNIYSSVINGMKLMNIIGRGFTVDGLVSEIYIDKDKKPPYDYIFNRSYFTVVADRFIRQINPVEINDGEYFIGVYHPLRGANFFDYRSKFYGDWVFRYSNPDYFKLSRVLIYAKNLDITRWLIIISIILWIMITLYLSSSLAIGFKEKIRLKYLMIQLEKIKNTLSKEEFIKRRSIMRKKGLGLTLKYTILILSLIITIVTATSLTLSILILKKEKINLANEMKERAYIIMKNYETTIRDIYSFEKGFHEAVDATINVATLPDIGFAFIKEEGANPFIKFGEKSNIFFKGKKIDQLPDEEKEKIISDMVYNKQAVKEIEAFKNSYDPAVKIDAKMYPEYDPVNLIDKYIFFKPIIVTIQNQNKVVGEIALGYSFDKILLLIDQEKNNLIRTALLVTIAAILIGLIGSTLLAAATIRPIRRMSKHVNVISTIDDYEKLVGTENEHIYINSNDEIGILASSINEMTVKLIEKAKSDKLMMVGKEIQKKFIPLESYETDHIEVFGFYEGAKGVSGDYFDYKKLDDENYAFIICDVAGKAVPAALIMVQISTVFRSYFTNFDFKKDKLNTVEVVNLINDTVAEKGFSGRFASILVMILNIRTGKLLLTNAGYNQLMVYRALKNQCEVVQLDSNSGAAGVFPVSMLPFPYVQDKTIINKEDIIYLYTDGIEESRNGKKISDEKGELKNEEFGRARVMNVLNNSKNKRVNEKIFELVEAEKKYRGTFEQYDDLTIIGVKRK